MWRMLQAVALDANCERLQLFFWKRRKPLRLSRMRSQVGDSPSLG
jgi:hypothetical protein